MLTTPHKKMKKVNKFGFVAECDCGHEHKFKSNEINVEKSNGSTVIFNDVYKCSKCGQTYDGIFESVKDRNIWYRNISPIGTLIALLLVVGLTFGGYKIYKNVFYVPPTNTDINKASNKELNDFYKWDNKQQKEKRDNSPAFNSNN